MCHIETTTYFAKTSMNDENVYTLTGVFSGNLMMEYFANLQWKLF